MLVKYAILKPDSYSKILQGDKKKWEVLWAFPFTDFWPPIKRMEKA